MSVADQEYVELLRLAAGTRTGHKRRVFVAEVTIRLCDGNAQQAEEPDAFALPRLILQFDRKKVGRLRQMVDVINNEA